MVGASSWRAAPHLVVFQDNCDLMDDPELIDLVEMDLREVLARYGFSGNEVTIIRGSAILAHDKPTDPEATRCDEERSRPSKQTRQTRSEAMSSRC